MTNSIFDSYRNQINLIGTKYKFHYYYYYYFGKVYKTLPMFYL